MKKFLLISFSLLLLSLLIVVAVFLCVSIELKQSQPEVPNGNEGKSTTTTTPATGADPTTPTVAPTGIPLRNLQLNESQLSVLDKMGVDVDTFVITPEIQACATAKLGDERMAEIIAGDTPSATETIKLVSCL